MQDGEVIRSDVTAVGNCVADTVADAPVGMGSSVAVGVGRAMLVAMDALAAVVCGPGDCAVASIASDVTDTEATFACESRGFSDLNASNTAPANNINSIDPAPHLCQTPRRCETTILLPQ